tara:strand:- start:259 stop:1248 length:990 start_codon:yes stop_codon:yes gene_type:complete
MYINLAIYSLLTFIILFLVARISYKINLLDIPNKRKIHLKPTAFTGGIGISISYLIAIMLFEFGSNNLTLVVSIGFLISIVGIIDDKYHLNIGGKLSLQIIPIFYLIVIENISLIYLGDYNFFRIDLNSFSVPFTLLSVLLLINACNYFDGLDGSLSSVIISVFLILYFLTLDSDIKLFLTIITLPILIFLCFNFKLFFLPKLFLGDSGSLFLGFVISFLLIFYANQKLVHPILLAWSVSLIVYEFLYINLERIQKKINLFTPGMDHLHHRLFNKTNSVQLTNFLLFFLNIFLFIIGYLNYEILGPLSSLIMFIITFIIFFILRKNLLK